MTSERNDQNAKSSEKAETLGEVVRDLRESVGETQGAFAVRFPVGRTRITEIEKNYLSAVSLRPKLIEDFPAAKERIEAAIDKVESRSKRSPARSTSLTITELRRDVARLMQAGQSDAARQLLEAYDGARWAAESRSAPGYKRPHVIVAGPEDSYWIDTQLHSLYVMSGDDKRADNALWLAYIDASVGSGMRNERIKCAVRIAQRQLKSASGFARAHHVLDETLSEHPDAPQLWLQKGELLWIEQAYDGAYAALTTALTLNADRKEVLRLRSQVLAEWGNVDAALDDIAEFLKYPTSYRVHRHEVISAHAYILTEHPSGCRLDLSRGRGRDLRVHVRNLEKAEELFSEVAVLSDGGEIGLVNYRLAYHYRNGRRDAAAALASYRKAVACAYPLDPVRFQLAQKEIQFIEKFASAGIRL
jgi:tetratricopeptide (TPR) repeat protein